MITSFIFVSEGIGYQYGIGKYVGCLQKEFAGKSDIAINVVVLSSKNCIKMTIVREADNINMVYTPFFGGNNKHDHIKNAEATLDAIANCFDINNSVIFHFLVWIGIFIAIELKKRYNNPVIFDLHSLEWQFPLNGNKHKFDSYWSQITEDCESRYNNYLKPGVLYEKQFCDLANHIIVRTNQMKKDVIETYKAVENKISVIYNGITEEEPSVNEKVAIKTKLGFTREERIILFVGRVCDQKGIQFLIEAFKLILPDFKDIRLVIAGGGYYDNYLGQCDNVWSKVTFTGRLDTDKIFSLYQVADIGVVPSLYEPFGYVILEMMPSIPVITTNIEGPDEIIQDGYTGFKVHVMENEEGERNILPEQLAEKIKLLLIDPYLAKSIIKNARLRLKEQFSAVQMAKNIVAVYYKLIF